MMKLREWKNTGMRMPVAFSCNTSGPARLARYTGTKGTTQGDRKDNSPALKATIIDIFSILIANLMLINLKLNIKSNNRQASGSIL